MRKNLAGAKVLILISILVLSSFGMFVTGSREHLKNDIEAMLSTEKGPRKAASEQLPTELASRATFPKPGSKIMNDGDSDGYFLGKIDPVTSKNSHSTLDNYLDDTDLSKTSRKDTPAYPGTVDIEFDLTIESRWSRDDNGTDGDEMLYSLRIQNNYNDVQIRNETTLAWSSAVTPFGDIDGEPNINDTKADNWWNNNLTINGTPAYEYDPNFAHLNSMWLVSENNTVADDNMGVKVVKTAEVFNDTVQDEFMDVRGDTMLNDTNDPTANPAQYRDLITIHTGPKVF